MASKVSFGPVRRGDHIALAQEWAPRLREADVVECRDISGMRPFDAIMFSLNTANRSWWARVDGEPAALFGVSPSTLVSGVGCPWFLSTPAMAGQGRAALRIGRTIVGFMQREFPILRNYVNPCYELGPKWLRALGFEVGPIVRLGEAQVPYYRIERRAS